MPRKTKEELNEKQKNNKAVVSKSTAISAVKGEKVATKTASKKATTRTNKKVETKNTEKKSTTKTVKTTTKKVPAKKVESKVSAKKAVKKSTTKNPTSKGTKSTTKKVTTNKTEVKASSKKVASKVTKKNPTKVSKTAKQNSSTKVNKNKSLAQMEYYDLPYRYNETIVKILAQTPKMLFIYWDVSDFDRENYIKKYGDNFFNETKPVLIIHNATKNYTFEVEINDFANSWYLNIEDPKCKYEIELGRRAKQPENYHIDNNYLYIASSNVIEAPNNHILFENQQNMVYFRNIKTNAITSKDMATLQFLRNMGKIYNIYDVYHKIYKDEDIIDLNNPSSSNPTSSFK